MKVIIVRGGKWYMKVNGTWKSKVHEGHFGTWRSI